MKHLLLAFGFLLASLGPSVANADMTPVNCFDQYSFGSVKVDLSGSNRQAAAGSSLPITASIVNENPYPIASGSVFIKVMRTDGSSVAQSNGFDVVDQFYAVKDISLSANGSTTRAFSWNVPSHLPAGSYKAVSYFVVADKFNMLGLTFSDDVYGGAFSFSVKSDVSSGISFDKNSVKVAGNPYLFAAFPPSMSSSSPVSIEATLQNGTNATETVPIIARAYRWDGTSSDLHLKDLSVFASLAPQERKVVRFDVTDKASVELVVIEADYKDTKSILNVRFTREGLVYPRINFLGLTKYPLDGTGTSTALVCVHATGFSPTSSSTKVVLSLKDGSGTEIINATQSGSISSDISGFKVDLPPRKAFGDLTLEADTYENDARTDTVVVSYPCSDLGPGSCVAGSGKASNLFMAIEMISSAVVVVLASILLLKRRKAAAAILGILIVFGLSSVATHSASAATTWNYSTTFPGFASASNPTRSSGQKLGPAGPTMYAWLSSLNVSVSYDGWIKNADTGAIISSGSTIPVGTRFTIENAPFSGTDISWSVVGAMYGTPYGYWGSAASCAASDFFQPTPPANWYSPLSITKPSVSSSVSGTAGVSQSGNVYTVTSPGTISASLIFGATSGDIFFEVYGGYQNETNCANKGGGATFNVPQQTILFSLNVAKPTVAPNNPSLTCPASAIVGNADSYSIAGTDPNGDPVSYKVIFGGSTPAATAPADLVLPSSGTVPSGTTEPFSKSWSSAGTQTVWGQTVNSSGLTSGWSSCQVTVSNSYFLNVSTSGSGSVSSNPAGISCGTQCSASYISGTTVTLTATPASGYSFTGWSGACSGTGACSVTMNSNVSVSAAFAPNTYTLNVSVTGSGSVSSNPAGISCGTQCSASYISGTTVTLTATPASGYSFTGWSGACSGTGYCNVTIGGPTSVAATFAAIPPSVSLSANPSSLPPGGGNTTVTWSSTNTSSCTASGAWSGTKSTNGSQTIAVTSDSTFTLTCSGPGGASASTATVSVTATPTPPSVSLSANPSNLPPGGGNVTLSWGSSNTSSCSASGAWSGVKATSGSETVTVTTDSTFTLTCSGPGGASASTAKVTVAAAIPPSVSLSANPSSLPPGGGNTTVTWSSTNTSSCTASGAWSGTKSTNGSQTIAVTSDSTFTLTCSGPGGASASTATVTVASGVPFCVTHPTDPSCITGGGVGGPGGTGGGGSASQPGFTITSVEGSTAPVRFLAQFSGTSDPRRIQVNPVNGLTSPVNLTVTDIRSKASGSALPNGVSVTYSFDGNAFATTSAVTMTYNPTFGEYVAPSGSIGAVFKAMFSKPITEAYNVTITGTTAGPSASYVLTIDPNAVNPNFQEI